MKRLRAGVDKTKATNKQCLAQSLADIGYRVHLRSAPVKSMLGLNSTNRSHSFITVAARKGQRSSSSRDVVVVECDLKSEFKMQNPPPHYKMLLEFLPDEFVGSHGRCDPLLSFLKDLQAA